jgi:aldose sugar dehydrogenase
VSLRVSRAVLSSSISTATPKWETVFDSKPCLGLGKMWPTTGGGSDESGGRMVRHAQGLLLTVGDHGFNSLEGTPVFSQDPATSYGKILLIDEAGTAVSFSIGHRNPQGLTIDNDGRIWESEHGPEGGDEINVIVRDGNYGWPLVTYGTEYKSDVWPLSLNARNHGKFLEPKLAFVPSIAPSEILQLKSNYLPHWSGDLLLASLRAGMLYRLRTSGDAVIYTEAINVDMRVRDLAEGRDGRIAIWGDDGQVCSLTLDSPTHRVTDASRQ